MVRSQVDIREIQRPIRARYSSDPAAAQVELRAHSGASDLTDPLHCNIEAGGGVIRSGTHPAAGGVGDVACSGDLLLASLAACQETTLRMVAANLGLDLLSVHVDVTGDWDARGTLGVPGVPVGITAIRCRTDVVVADDERGERADRLLRSAEKYCVILNTLRDGVPVDAQFYIRKTP